MSIAFLPGQPSEPNECIVSIEPDLVTAMNCWRLTQSPVLDANEAIIALIRAGLATQGSESVTTLPNSDADVDRLVQSFKSFLAEREAR